VEGVAVVEGHQEVTLFTQMNLWAEAHFPGVLWAYIECFLGLSMVIISFAQRTIAPRFRPDLSRCGVDRIMIYVSQAGLVALGTIGALVMVDAITNPVRPPRIFAIGCMTAYLLIHGRVVILSFLELWPLKYTKWHRRYGAKVYYAAEYQLLAKRSADP